MRKAFTLIELLVAVAIVGILATLVTVNFTGARKSSRDARRQTDVKNYTAAVEKYRISNTSYFITDTGGCGSAGSTPAATTSGCTGADGASYGRMNFKTAKEADKTYAQTTIAQALLNQGMIDKIAKDPSNNKDDTTPDQLDYVLIRCEKDGSQALGRTDAGFAVWTQLEKTPSLVSAETTTSSCGGSLTNFNSDNDPNQFGSTKLATVISSGSDVAGSAELDNNYFATGSGRMVAKNMPSDPAYTDLCINTEGAQVPIPIGKIAGDDGRCTDPPTIEREFYNPQDIIVSPDGQYVYVADMGKSNNSEGFSRGETFGRIAQIDTTTDEISFIPMPRDELIHRFVITPDGRFFYVIVRGVGVLDGGAIYKIDIQNKRVIKRFGGFNSSTLTNIVISLDGQHVYVMNMHEGSISIIKTSNNTIRTLPIGAPRSIGADGMTLDGIYVYVSKYDYGTRNNHMLKIDTTTGSIVKSLDLGANDDRRFAININSDYLYATSSFLKTVSVIDREENIIKETINTKGFPNQIISTGDYIYLLEISRSSADYTLEIIDTRTNEITSTITPLIGLYWERMAATPDNKYLYLVSRTKGRSQISRFDLSTNTIDRVFK